MIKLCKLLVMVYSAYTHTFNYSGLFMDWEEKPYWVESEDDAHIIAQRKESEETKSKCRAVLDVKEFEIAFPLVLEYMVDKGSTFMGAVDNYRIPLSKFTFAKWIKSNSERSSLLKEAEELSAEMMAENVTQHSLGSFGPEDIQRSKLIVDTYKHLMKSYNKRFAQDRPEVDESVSIVDALAAANERVINGVVKTIESDEVLDALVVPDEVKSSVGDQDG